MAVSQSELSFARRMEGMTGNVIREILKLTQQPDVISFAGGLPSPDSFPESHIRRILEEIGGEFTSILQYATTEGYPPLREFLAAWVQGRGIEATPDQVLILTGSQQGIDLACKALLDPGDVVLVERPTYLTALQVFRMYQARAVAVPGDDEGIDPDALEKAIAEHRPKMLYAVPTFRNPSGETWSPERRRRIAQLTAAAGVVVVEDDPYGLLRYDGQPFPAVKAFDEAGNIIYLGSFSKIISPGLRVGYAVAREQLLRKLVIGKQTTDVHSSNLSQYIVNAFGRSPAFQSHLETICAQYRAKRDRMLAAMEAHFPAEARWTRPQGGLFTWVTLPETVSTTRLLERAVQQKVAFIPGTPFYTDGGGDHSMRLNFSNASFAQIDEGIARLGRTLKEALA